MSDNLPDWYPLANATSEDVEAWLDSDTPPFDEMRDALPWLMTDRELRNWLDGARSARDEPLSPMEAQRMFPGLAKIPLPPLRSCEVLKQ